MKPELKPEMKTELKPEMKNDMKPEMKKNLKPSKISKVKLLLFVISFMIVRNAFSGTAGSFYNDQPIKLIDNPIAGTLDTDGIAYRGFFFGDGSLLTEVYYSPIDDLDLGVMTVFNNFLGTDQIIGQGIPGFHVSYRLKDETLKLPGLKIGFDNQGRGRWDSQADRHEMPSPGFFLALSKHFEWKLGGVSLHAASGYSIDNKFNGELPSTWLGLDFELWKYFGVSAEYIYLYGDDEIAEIYDNGVLNVALSASISSQITISLALRNLLYETMIYNTSDRTLIIEVRL